MIELAQQISKELDNIKFENLFLNFKRIPFAIYSDGTLYFDDHFEKFVDQKNIAILSDVDFDSNPKLIAAFVIKEMFLLFLSKNYNNQFPNDLKLLDYPSNYLNYDYLAYEKGLLKKSFLSKDLNEKLNYLRMFMNIRHLRREVIGNIIFEEYKMETIEGLSEYVFYKSLKQLDIDLSKQYLKEALHTMNTYSRDFFDVRHSNYFIGCMLLIILDDLKISISSDEFKKRTLFENLLGRVEYIEEMISYIPTKGLIKHIKRYNQEVKDTFTDFFFYKTKKITGNFKIVNYDPYNMLKFDNQIYHKCFVELENDSLERFFINGPVITRVDEKNNIVCYFERIK